MTASVVGASAGSGIDYREQYLQRAAMASALGLILGPDLDGLFSDFGDMAETDREGETRQEEEIGVRAACHDEYDSRRWRPRLNAPSAQTRANYPDTRQTGVNTA